MICYASFKVKREDDSVDVLTSVEAEEAWLEYEFKRLSGIKIRNLAKYDLQLAIEFKLLKSHIKKPNTDLFTDRNAYAKLVKDRSDMARSEEKREEEEQAEKIVEKISESIPMEVDAQEKEAQVDQKNVQSDQVQINSDKWFTEFKFTHLYKDVKFVDYLDILHDKSVSEQLSYKSFLQRVGKSKVAIYSNLKITYIRELFIKKLGCLEYLGFESNEVCSLYRLSCGFRSGKSLCLCVCS
ncbi:hypothetical protein L6452_34731 [Arctium lappa]|uniref:Uncharacterized protein n=1 Tax=Arctium lappa TaxID=4217 RepID=A0ACB8YK75_ARCLA|nr:hypothetical protein L6452_34731 [Arctium lappa]